MNTWTSSALQALEGYLERNRLRLAASGADPDEVVADLRRHVEEEVATLSIPVVTEDDVDRIVRRIGPPAVEKTSSDRPSPPDRVLPRETKAGRLVLLSLFGVVLPVVTLAFEWFTGLCAGLFFDPIPTAFHVALVAMVPMMTFWGLWILRDRQRGVSRWLWLGNGAMVGVSVFYSLLFLPMTPFAVIGIIYLGFGFLPLAALLSLVCGLWIRRCLRQRQSELGGIRFKGWGWSVLLPALLLGLMALPGPLTRHWMVQAGSDSPGTARRAVEWLRTLGDEETMLMSCYGRGNRFWIETIGGRHPDAQLARQVYYRVTGRPFNASPPPLSRYQAAGRGVFDEFDWDDGLGGDTVAGRVRGLSMVQSRFDGLCRAEEGWAYLEWILEFRNDHERRQREARGQILLPPGAVVSRLTLWVNGEEREAAFAGQSQVREAYQKVAVVQRRDPVLVTTSGPDRVLMQCFPIEPCGGTMKVRIGITAPLAIESADQTALRLPCFIERNFSVRPDFEHSLWLESTRQPGTSFQPFVVDTTRPARIAVRGKLRDDDLSSVESTLRFTVKEPNPVCAADRKSDRVRVIVQSIEQSNPPPPARVAIVLDGSHEMTGFFPQLARAFGGLPAQPETSIWLAQDGVRQIHSSAWPSGESASGAVRRLRGVGGQDNVAALLQAWEWAAVTPGGVVLWIHGTQPVLLDGIEALKQRMEWRPDGSGPTVIDVFTRPGPNRISEQLAGLDAIAALSRLGGIEEDLDRLFGIWSGRQPQFNWVRNEDTSEDVEKKALQTDGSAHVIRLWAFDQVRGLMKSRKLEEAIHLAALHQLVTPVTGAVVLETARQYADAGLTPVDAGSVPVVPEPRTWLLTLIGVGGFLLWRNHRTVRARFAQCIRRNPSEPLIEAEDR